VVLCKCEEWWFHLVERILELLETLSATPGPVGRENLVQDIVKHELGKFCSSITQDKIGNLLATLEGNGKHYVIVSHADEVGFLVSGIDEKGFIRAKWNTQGHKPDLRLLPGQWVLIMTDKGLIPGYFAVKTGHIAGPEGSQRTGNLHWRPNHLRSTSRESRTSCCRKIYG